MPTPAFSIEQALEKKRCIDDAERSMSNHTARTRRGCKCTLHSNLQYIANWHSLWPKMQATSRQEKSSEQSASNMAARTLQMHMRLAVAKKNDLCCKFVMVAPVDGTIISMAYYLTRIL